MFELPALEEYLARFRRRLHMAGFERVPDAPHERWSGIITVDWTDSASGQHQTGDHHITISFRPGFPYREPAVTCEDTDPPLKRSWHLNPGKPPTLCLWQPDTGWQPHYTAQRLLRRIYDWFVCYHTDTWPAESAVPDLHLYLKPIGTILIGKEWQPECGKEQGAFTLWYRPGFFRAVIATAGRVEGAKTEEPEVRLSKHMSMDGKTNPDRKRARGPWFRLPRPVVPPATLAELLRMLDEELGKDKGWAREICIRAVGAKSRETAFPVALGYLDHTGEERWLFLWAAFPEERPKAYAWSRGSALHALRLGSFQTAPARPADLLRRSGYLSQHLGDTRVAVFGVGALGSPTALLLAKSGVGELRVVDSDLVMPGNPMRHICGMDLVGWLKTRAVKYAIETHHIDCRVVPHEATWEEAKLLNIIQDCDLVIDTTANRSFSLFLSGLCVTQGKPLLTAVAQRRARVGKLIVRTSKADACLTCYHAGEWPPDAYPVVPANPAEAFVEDGCGGITEEAVALDLEAIANQVARTAIKVLRGETRPGNLGLLVNEPLPEVTDGPLQHVGMHWLRNAPLPGCVGCDRAQARNSHGDASS